MRKISVLLLLFVLSFSLTVNAELQLTDSDQQATTDWKKSVVRAEGTGWADHKGPRARSLAKIAAVAKAQAELIKKIKGVTVTSETKIANQEFQSEIITTRASGTLKGARIIKEKALGESGYLVVMEVKFYGKDGIIKAIYPKLKEEAATNQLAEAGSDFGVSSSSNKEEIKNYTGIIINTANLRVEPAIAPKIYAANGELVYGLSKINYEGVIKDSLVRYRPSLADAKADNKVGDNPLIITAQDVRGDFKTDLVLSNQDAKLVNRIGYQNNIFKNRKVVIVGN